MLSERIEIGKWKFMIYEPSNRWNYTKRKNSFHVVLIL